MTSEILSTEKQKNGLGVIATAIFIAGEITGSGILAMPKAVVNADWFGFIFLIIICINAAYGGILLGSSWNIIEERYPEYKGSSRAPYCIIAEKAVGPWASLLISCCMRFTLFGASVVYLLLASQIVQSLLVNFTPGVTFCWWFLIFAVLVTPPMWLGSPKDFCFVGVGALVTTSVSSALIFVQIVMDGVKSTTAAPHTSHSISQYFLAFGTIQFCFGGASIFPTLQNDMKHREKFYISAIIGFMVSFCTYFPLVIGGYVVFGNNVADNIALSLSKGPVITLANALLAVHLVCALLIVINPVCQSIEDVLHVPQKFGIQRCATRTMIVVLMVIVGESVPNFGKILALVGGSTVTLGSFVMPYYIYICLCSQSNKEWPDRSISTMHRLVLWALLILGVVGGLATTYNSLYEILSPETFTKPCYLR